MQQKKTKSPQKRRRMCNQAVRKCHYRRGSCYNEEGIHFGKAKCTSSFYKLSRSNGKCGSMWVLVALTLGQNGKCGSMWVLVALTLGQNGKCGSMWVLVALTLGQVGKVEASLSSSPSPTFPCQSCPFVHRAFYIITSSTKFVTKQNNKIVGCLWLFLWAWVMCNLSSYEGIQIFYKVIDAKCVLFAKKFNDVIFLSFCNGQNLGCLRFYLSFNNG